MTEFASPLWQPRVEFGYPGLLDGLPCTRSLPFVIGVLGSFGGAPAEARPAVAERVFLDAGALGLQGLFDALAPELNLVHEGKTLCLRPRRLEDFGPAGLATLLPAGFAAPALVDVLAWRALAASWRGLAHLLACVPPDDSLLVRVLDISKAELHKTLKRWRGSVWDQSPIFKALFEKALGTRGEPPLACVIGDFGFDASPADVETLAEMAHIASAAAAPFIAAAAPALLQMESWQELPNPRDLQKIFSTAEYAAWRSLRESEEALHLVLALPGFQPKDTLAEAGGAGWVNPAFALGAVIARAFRTEGWCARIDGATGGGALDAVAHGMAGPGTEVTIADRRAAELSSAGLVPLAGAQPVTVSGAVSLHRPALYDDPDRTRAAERAARLPHVLCLGLVLRHLRYFTRELIEQGLDGPEMEQRVNAWLSRWVDPDPVSASAAQQALRPLAQAQVEAVESADGGGWTFKLLLRLNHPLEAATSTFVA